MDSARFRQSVPKVFNTAFRVFVYKTLSILPIPENSQKKNKYDVSKIMSFSDHQRRFKTSKLKRNYKMYLKSLSVEILF